MLGNALFTSTFLVLYLCSGVLPSVYSQYHSFVTWDQFSVTVDLWYGGYVLADRPSCASPPSPPPLHFLHNIKIPPLILCYLDGGCVAKSLVLVLILFYVCVTVVRD